MTHRWRLISLGAVLCLLAAVFSIEAKMAWYSPAPAQSEISAAKLQPAEAPRLVAQALGVQTTGSLAYHAHASLQLAWLAVIALLAAVFAPRRRAYSGLTQVYSSPGFSPLRYSRPPPTR